MEELSSEMQDQVRQLESLANMDPDFANAIHVWRDFSSAQEIYEQGLKFIKQGMGL